MKRRYYYAPLRCVMKLSIYDLNERDRERFSAALRRNEIQPLTGDGDMQEAPHCKLEGKQS